MAAIGAVVSLIGTVVSAAGTIAAGERAPAAAEYQAKQLDIKANEEVAAAQREEQQTRREKNLVLSRQQALAASSGLGASDPTIADLAGETEAFGEYRAGLVRYGGEERSTGLKMQAEGARYTGESARIGATYSAFGTILGGVSSFFSKYGNGGFGGAQQNTYLYGYG